MSENAKPDKSLFEGLDAYNQIDVGRFDLPPLASRRTMEVGVLAQLATSAPAHDWVWVEVRERTPFGYRGIVDVAPPQESGCTVAVGDIVDFNARHVHDIHRRLAVSPGAIYEAFLAD